MTTTRVSGPVAEKSNDYSIRAIAKRRRVRLGHIHPMTREQQMALVEEARAARLAAQRAHER